MTYACSQEDLSELLNKADDKEVREKQRIFKSFYKTVGGNEGTLCRYPTRLDTYGCGCAHDCDYCYAKSLLDFRKLWSPKNPAVADLDAIARRIKRIPAGTIVRLGGMTDCFQPVEAKHKVTKAAIAMLNRAGIGYLIVTKSHLVATDEYLELLDPDLAHVQVSVSCTDKAKALSYERCSSPQRRLEAVAKLQDAGIDAHLRLAPFLRPLVSFDAIREVVDPQKILIEFLRVNHWIERWLKDKDLGIDLSHYELKHGGYRHMSFDRKLEQLIEIHAAFPNAQLSVCEDVPDHHRIWSQRLNANKEDCCNLRRTRHA